MDYKGDIPFRKLGFLRWEADVQIGTVVYTFQSWTQAGAIKKAIRYRDEETS